MGTALILLAAGVGAGLAGAIAGLASLVSYPVLLALGLPPVTANITNTVSLLAYAVGSIVSSAPELRGKWAPTLKLAAMSAAGGIGGALLLLVIDPKVFEWLVPIFIAGGSLWILGERNVDARPRTRWATWLPWGVGAVGVYGGFFGPAAGAVLLAVILAGTGLNLAEGSAVRNVTMSASSCIAAVVFIINGNIQWRYVLWLSIGYIIGSYLGPIVVRHSPARVLKTWIGIAGILLAGWLAWQAFAS